MQLADLTWPAVGEYLKKKDLIIIPIGSTEQHGPTGIIGTDYVSSQVIAEKVGERTRTIVAPPICYGMARHHMAFPGSATLAPSTFILFIRDIVQSFAQHGFRKMIFINGHGGNIAPLLTAYSEAKEFSTDLYLKTINWYELPEVTDYEKQAFGEENGFHATCGEVSVTQFLRPTAFEKIPWQEFSIERPEFHMPLSATQFRNTFPDGRMMSNPGLASGSHGEAIFDLAVNAICKKISDFSY